MDNVRVLAWVALAALLVMNYSAWQNQFGQKPTTSPTQSVAKAPDADDVLPPLGAAPTEATSTPTPSDTPAPTIDIPPTAPAADAKVIHVRTDVFDLDINTRGGELTRADLIKYPKVKNQPDNPVRLFTTNPDEFFVAKSGLRTAGASELRTDKVTFEAGATEYRAKASDSELQVPLTWTDGQGVTVVKTYIFKPGSYRIDLRYDVTNQSGKTWTGASYVRLQRHFVPVKRSYFNVEGNAFRGPAVSNGDKYETINVEKDHKQSYNYKYTGGWLAAIQHHFVAAAIPPAGVPYDFTVSFAPNNDYTLTGTGPLVAIPDGKQQVFKETLFVGPKLNEQMNKINETLYLTADYGKLSSLARPLFKLLAFVQQYLGNWGWSIVFTTFLIKLAFYKLTAASGRSMAKMRNLGPRIKAIQERYKDDRQRLGQEMMDIYKKEKVNPLAGCLPVLIQIPFFFAYYWVLLESVEMRQAPFLGWINDLSSRDPYFILPALMCAAMVGQFKLQPMPSTDPVQAKIFAFMPVVMSATMAFFPAGLVLYWLTNTLLSIAQQWRINKLVALEGKPA